MTCLKNNKNAQNYSNKNNDNNMHTIRTKKGTFDCAYAHVDFSQPSAIDMKSHVNVNHQLGALIPDLVNK